MGYKLGNVYIIRCIDLCKIGSTYRRVEDRIKEVMSVPFEYVEVIHTFRSNEYKDAEKFLHRKFKSKRVSGEWFSLNENDLEEIRSIVGFEDEIPIFLKDQSIELFPCPFCGNVPLIHLKYNYWPVIRCIECDYEKSTRILDENTSLERVVEAWQFRRGENR